MKTSRLTDRAGFPSGVTLLELSIVIVVVLLFLGMTWIGVSAWKKGSDRASCVINIRNVQLAVRGYSNSNSLEAGDDTTPLNLSAEIVGPGKFIPSTPLCPGGGVYAMGGNTVPAIGTLYLNCSLDASDGHVPAEFTTW